MRRDIVIARLIGAFACILPAQAFGQFYHPDRKEYQTPEQYGLKYESVTFQSKDGTKLHGWFVPATSTAIGTIVHFHGNAQNMTAHFSFVQWLPEQGFNLFAFDYRGYGRSEGAPSRAGVQEDAFAALQYIQTRTDVDPNKLLVLGQSLGGAIAVRAIADRGITGICGIAIESTFDSYTAMAKEKAPDVLASLFISNAWSPDAVVASLSPAPMVFIHGTADRVVPYERGKRLFDLAKMPKEMWTIEGGGHTEAFTSYGEIYRPRLVAFFRRCLEQNRGRTNEPGGRGAPHR